MTTTIALAGKGGVGKTTIAAMVIKYLSQAQDGAILAIDAGLLASLGTEARRRLDSSGLTWVTGAYLIGLILAKTAHE